ncbi:peroxidase family protein [Phyllobacterium zundukense]|uniref:Ig-like domain-containing protein n=1 Tax=Phyllobacterium zundukense TaxID=1867719 RepID=A0ACD4D8Q9_9HYPH|nr:peroxidase family protein [Phyllobacterium zundukense]UXN62195.1 Ig-like domain-containing protein [Phyllobacterium zundukense]
MVSYIRSDLDFILAQIKIAEAHAAGTPLYGPGGLIPTYNLAWGLRTVDGSYNHLLPGQEQWGAADQEFLELLAPQYRTVMVDPDGAGPSGPIPITYTPGNDVDGPGTFADPGDVIDPEVRTISNLIVDQTLGNPAAILTALQRAGNNDPGMVITATISAAYAPLQDEFRAVADAQRVEAAAAAAAAANPGNTGLQTAAADAAAALAAAQATLDAAAGGTGGLYELLAANGIELDGANVHLPNIAPDEGLSAPFNSWFTLFGQFFDHGLDLVNKGGNGAVMIPLQPDDPLYVTPTAENPNPPNFMILTRATTSPGADGFLGDNPATVGVDESLDDGRPVNTTTSYVDQNQTYTSHSSHQVFIRQYETSAATGRTVATGNLIEGGNGGMATWAEVKAQARTMLGIDLTDADVGSVPLLRTDQYGNFIPDPATGFAQVITGIGADGIPNTSDDIVISGTPAAPVSLATAIRTNHAFLADIAHGAAPEGLADGDTEIGGNIPIDGEYDNELLDAHFIAGDGRVNENIGLTAVHHVFHAEHNRLVEHTKEVTLADAQAILDGGGSEAEAVAFLNEWLAVDVTSVPADATGLIWDGARLFQAAKFGTEMQYQHLVFEEFARKIQPNINVFLVPDGFDTTLNPSIVAEFAHVVYRFGHSMLTESIDQFDPTFTPDHISLIQGFLNPTAFNGPGGTIDDGVAAGSIIRGMTRQVGNQIDEFVTSALRNNLLGLPLDLATINLARGRDTGVPSLNTARAEFYEASNQNVLLKPYESWVDFAGHLKNEASIINFIASYGTHTLITTADTLQEKRDAALTIITGVSVGGMAVPADALDFLNATGAYAGGSLGGLNNVDLWIGGLAEETMPFGGMLGSTFNFVFEVQMENLQSGDRFYYLQRLDGLHLFGEMENNSFAAMIMRNTDATHLPSDVFSTPGLILEVDRTKQYNPDLGEDAGLDGILQDDPGTAVDESADNRGLDPVGSGILTQLVIRNNPATPGADTNYLRYTGDDHVVLGGTDGADFLIAGIGDDTLFGDGGNDNMDGGFGNDIINGGDGDDIIKDSGGDDNIKAGKGNDVVHAGPGLDLVMGNDGQDFIFLGTDAGSEVFAGTGNDFIYGNKNAERILGNEGDDWIETGTFDGAPGDNFDEIFAHDGIDGNDVFLGDGGFDEYIGEGGDDVMVGSAGRGKMVGMSGFDWATYKDNLVGVNADLSIPIIFDEAPTLPQNAALDEYESMEGLSGTRFNDVLKGTQDVAADRAPLANGGTTGYRGSVLDAEGIALIQGLQEVLGAGVTTFDGGDIILGGDGSDAITGNAGDDIIDGDKYLDVQIAVYAAGDTEHAGTPIALHKSMTTLAASMFNGSINPGQLGIVRMIKNSNDDPDSDGIADVDRAVFSGARDEYDIDFNTDGTITVAHTGGLATDGTDTIRNVEILDFTDQDISLQAPTLDLHGDVTTTTTVSVPNAYRDFFDTAAFNNSNGTVNWAGTPWVEADDSGGVTAGQIQLDAGAFGGSNELRFLSGDGASIARTVNLSGLTTATLSFDYDRLNNGNSIDAGETIEVQFSASGSFAPGNFTVLQTIGSNSGNPFTGAGSSSLNLNLTGAGANSAIRFVSSAINTVGEEVRINNFNIATTTSTTTTVPGTPGNNYQASYAENGLGVAIAAGALITDDGTTMASAQVVLTNASAGDVLSVLGGLPGGITSSVDSSVPGQITLNLSGTASIANYRTAIQQVRYANSSDNPTPGARIIQVTVNDGLLNSNVATATVTVTATNDAPVGNNDTVITNVAAGNFSIALSALLANDTDPEGSPVTITSVGGQNGLNAPTLGATAVTVSNTGGPGGSFNYVASDGALTDPTTTVTVTQVTGTINGGAGSEIIVGDLNGTTINGGGGNDNINAGDGGDTISGGTGDDIILAGTGNDTIIWNAAGATDGFDMVNGEAGGIDTFIVNGVVGTAETFRIYARAEAILAGIAVSGANTEIIITRTVGLTTTIIAELDNIEEISVNTLNTTANNGNNPNTPDGGVNNGDTIQVIGNFNTPFTSLNFSTITIDGNTGDDTVDISALSSAHRIVFRSNGGNDTIVGNLRPQDVIELPNGATIADYEATIEDGVTTLTSSEQTIKFTAPDGMPQIGGDPVDDDDDVPAPGSDSPGAPVVGTANADVLLGTANGETIIALGGTDTVMGGAGADVIRGDEGDDFISAQDGDDMAFGGAGSDDVLGGAGNDMLYGDAGSDRIFGDAGNDLINTGSGNDTAHGGDGNDMFVAEASDGNDNYYGDAGSDTLDMAAITANLTVDLGTGFAGRGSALGSQSGNDTLWNVENVVTGSGNDTITASSAVNVIDGGAGNDTFRFLSAGDADGDTIAGFQPGDKLDLGGIDANGGAGGNQSFTLVAGSTLSGAAQLVVTHETREDGEYTIVQGSVDGDSGAELRLSIKGNHDLTNSDFHL